MIKRSVVALDRVVVLVLGLLLVLGGAALIAWQLGSLQRLWPTGWQPIQETVRLDTSFLDAGWWPWALGAGGVVLVVLCLAWLVGHIPSRSVGTVVLPGGAVPGTLRIDPTPVVRTAAEQLRSHPSIRKASGEVIRERREIVARLRITLESSGNLHDVARAVEQVSTDMRQVLSTDRITGRVEIAVARGVGPADRVN